MVDYGDQSVTFSKRKDSLPATLNEIPAMFQKYLPFFEKYLPIFIFTGHFSLFTGHLSKKYSIRYPLFSCGSYHF